MNDNDTDTENREGALKLMRAIPGQTKQLVKETRALETEATRLHKKSLELLDRVTSLAQLIRTATAWMDGENHWDELGKPQK